MPEYYDPDDVEYWNHEEAFRQVIHAEEPPFDALIDSAVPPDIVEFEVEESVPDSSASFYTSHPPINLAKLWPPFDALVDLRTPPDGPEPEQDEYIDGPAVDIRLIREALDATQPFDLFEGVTIAETDEQTRFEVPERYIRTPHDGVFILRVYGRQAKLKERDDYGDIRFTDAGNIFWAPHLYPFEEVDGKGLPVIMERERCKLNVSLQPVSGESTDMHLIVALRTPYGELSAREAPESYNSEWISYFKEFQFHGKPLLADTVTYPDKRWASFDEYAAEKQLSLEEYIAIMRGRQRFPEEYKAQERPDNWQDRKPSNFGGDAFGSVWVPIDELRKGIVAELTFPCFQDGSDVTTS